MPMHPCLHYPDKLFNVSLSLTLRPQAFYYCDFLRTSESAQLSLSPSYNCAFNVHVNWVWWTRACLTMLQGGRAQ